MLWVEEKTVVILFRQITIDGDVCVLTSIGVVYHTSSGMHTNFAGRPRFFILTVTFLVAPAKHALHSKTQIFDASSRSSRPQSSSTSKHSKTSGKSYRIECVNRFLWFQTCLFLYGQKLIWTIHCWCCQDFIIHPTHTFRF